MILLFPILLHMRLFCSENSLTFVKNYKNTVQTVTSEDIQL